MKRPIFSPVTVITVSIFISALIAVAAWMKWQRPLPVDSPASHSAVRVPDARVNINAASPAELSVLPMIGPKLADRIAEDRMDNGPFTTLEDLQRVRGIGPATVEAIREWAVAEE